jgi:hypothetical protein
VQKTITWSLRKLVAVLVSTALIISFFNLTAVAVTTLGTTPSIYMQNGALNVTQLYVNGKNITNTGDCPVPTTGTFTLTSDTTEHTIVSITPTKVEEVDYFLCDLSVMTQNCTIKVYVTIGGSYVPMDGMTATFGAGSHGQILKPFIVDTAWKITIQSGVAEGASRSIPYEYFVNVY